MPDQYEEQVEQMRQALANARAAGYASGRWDQVNYPEETQDTPNPYVKEN